MICKSIEELQDTVREKLKNDTTSDRALSDGTGISKSMLNYFRKGERNLAFENLDKLAEHYDVKYQIKNY